MILLLFCGTIHAQEDRQTRRDLPLLSIDSLSTIHFISPEPIQYSDISSSRLAGDLPEKNVLRIRLLPDSTAETASPDLGVITIIGESFIAQYNLRRSGRRDHMDVPALVQIIPEHMRPLETAVSLTSPQMKLHALDMLASRKGKAVEAVKDHSMAMRVNALRVIGDFIFIDLSISNETRLAYDIDQLRLSIEDRKIKKATNAQSLEIQPVWQLHQQPAFRRSYRNILVLKKLTFPGNKVLQISLTEKQVSGRILSLRLSYRDILSADTF